VTRRLTGGLVLLALTASTAAAQQPGAAPRDSQPGMGAGVGMPMMMNMDSLNRRLDSLVARMNRASGNKKVDAMAAVINELIAQRKAMMTRMHEQMMMADTMQNMMGGAPAPAPSPAAKTDSAAADTAGHAGHHPPR
jgi:hypothetical protein